MKYLRRLMTRDEFICKANLIHNQKYNYDQVEIVSMRQKVIIGCQTHGLFEQTIGVHLKGSGCKICHDSRKRLSQSTFIERAKSIHSGLYDYNLVNYRNIDTPIRIICVQHGPFDQRPYVHLKGSGCGHCAQVKKKNTYQFIHEAITKHGTKYDYSQSNYQGSLQNITIVCPQHGKFEIAASLHTAAGIGCPRCCSSVSKEETIWLNLLGIPQSYRQYKISINDGSYIKVDGYDPVTNTVYEYNGDYYHGNPTKYPADGINYRSGYTFGTLYQNTLKREQLLKDYGYNVVSIWGSEFKTRYKTEISEYKQKYGAKKVCTVI